ncbi:hypothetical protein ACN42_g8723 [Penicillium freii]|uniref:Uncharacterized protein n=1 Tax=Penicillium freii TaxID=48697 RepID=A0A101MDF5_PENFR|nr:hypothetical protein ACN42_g8723 [Penicillium freii]
MTKERISPQIKPKLRCVGLLLTACTCCYQCYPEAPSHVVRGVVPLNALFFSTRVSNLVLQLLCNLIWTCSVKFGLLCFSASTSSSSFCFPHPYLHSILFTLFPILPS